MKPGTPGFIGASLKEAREANQITITQLSKRLNISKQAISSYEKGKITPGPLIMDKISEIFQLPKQFFFRSPIHTGSNTIFYRSMSATTMSSRTRAKRRFSWLKEIVNYLQEYVELPKPNLPNFELHEDPTYLSFEEIENFATECRDYWGIGYGPISNTVLLLENNGVILSRGKLHAKTLDAFSQWDNDSPYIFLGSDKNNPVRSRFDIGHELGHLVFHRSIPNDHLKSKDSLQNKERFKLIESQANRFAAAFLLPEKSFLNDLYAPTLDAFRNLKEKWKTSIAMMIMRCKHLGIIDSDYERKLWMNYSRRGWKTQEPLDDKFNIEVPVLLKRSLELLLDNNILSLDDFIYNMPFKTEDIEELLCLPAGFFKNKNQSISTLRLRKNEKSKNSKTTGKIIQFPPKN
jgi:Zn-dependent peptidase ImmA (M78 family)/transcriptional regulator with XRE-family HTH domain